VIDPVHARLEEWARWANQGIETIGWPQATMLGRMIEEGPTGASQSGSPPITIPDRVAQVDRAVAGLEPIDKGVIRTFYFSWAPPETLWMGCIGVHSAFGFRMILRRAQWKISQVIY